MTARARRMSHNCNSAIHWCNSVRFSPQIRSSPMAAPLRTLLWEPRTIFALQRLTAITDRQLARYCHALAA